MSRMPPAAILILPENWPIEHRQPCMEAEVRLTSGGARDSGYLPDLFRILPLPVGGSFKAPSLYDERTGISSQPSTVRMLTRSLMIAATWLALLPLASEAQGAADAMAGIRNGGGWVEIALEDGQGSMSTLTMPSLGMNLSGCMTVWPGHSGEFEVRAHERILDQVLEFTAEPGVGVPFSHTFGMRAQIDFDFHWSEPRDTTLMLWIGVDLGAGGSDESCEPKYEGG
jgi:hypothetical protein